MAGGAVVKRFKHIVLAFAGCLALAACATGGGEDEVAVINAPDVDTAYKDMALEMSNGSVQIYDISEFPATPPVPPSPGALAASPYDDGGRPVEGEENVMVYPVGEAVPYPPLRPSLAPPSEYYRPLESPFGGALQTPAPLPPESRAEPEGAVSTVYFGHGSSRLDADGGAAVAQAVQEGGDIVVSGYASKPAQSRDPVERSIVNLKMSMDRAFQVSSRLIREGVPASAIETRAYGDGRGDEAESDAESRKVEIYASGGGAAQATDEAPIPALDRYY